MKQILLSALQCLELHPAQKMHVIVFLHDQLVRVGRSQDVQDEILHIPATSDDCTFATQLTSVLVKLTLEDFSPSIDRTVAVKEI